MSSITTKFDLIQRALTAIQPILLALNARARGMKPTTDTRPPRALLRDLRETVDAALPVLHDLIHLVDGAHGEVERDGIVKVDLVRERLLNADKMAFEMAKLDRLGALALVEEEEE